MKTIHLSCGHSVRVKTWPSSAGMAKVRKHYKKYHPAKMRAMTRKSLRTKRKRGLINPVILKKFSVPHYPKWTFYLEREGGEYAVYAKSTYSDKEARLRTFKNRMDAERYFKSEQDYYKKGVNPCHRSNPCRQWYVGFPRGQGRTSRLLERSPKLFQLSKKPTRASHGHLYRSVTGPFRNRQAAMKYRNEMSGA